MIFVFFEGIQELWFRGLNIAHDNRLITRSYKKSCALGFLECQYAKNPAYKERLLFLAGLIVRHSMHKSSRDC